MAYTPEALSKAAEFDASNPEGYIQARVQAGIDELNKAIRVSGQSNYTQVEQVGPGAPSATKLIYMSDYNERDPAAVTDPQQRFAYIRNAASGLFGPGIVPAARDAYEADIVATIVRDQGNVPSQPLYGLAFTQRQNCNGAGSPLPCVPGPTYGTYFASSVTSLTFITVNGTFAHEVGHMFGGEHDPVNANILAFTPSFLHSYGHKVPGVAMDLMAETVCNPLPCLAKSIQYSSPSINFELISPPTPSGTSVPYNPAFDGPRTRDVAQTIRKLALDMSNFRGSTDACAPGVVDPPLLDECLYWDGVE